MFLKKIAISNIFHFLSMAGHLTFGLLLANYFGASRAMDAYVVALNFITVFSGLFTNSQQCTFIPFLSRVSEKTEQRGLVSSILRANLVLFTLFIFIVILCSRWLAGMLAPGLSGQQLEITIDALRILSLFFLLANLSTIGVCLLDYHYKFELKYFLLFVQTLVSILMLVLLVGHIGIYAAAWATLASNSVFICLLWWLAWRKQGFRFVSGPLINNGLVRYFVLMAPVFIASLFVWLIRYSETVIASFLESGSLSYLSYCSRIEIYTAVVSAVISGIYFPVLSRLASDPNKREFLNVCIEGLQLVVVVSFALASFVALFSEPIVTLLFERGRFSVSDTLALSSLMRYYSVAYFCGPLGTFLANVYFCYNQPKLAVVFSIISSVVNILLVIVLGRVIGLLGFGLAASISYVLGNLLQLSNIKRVNSNYSLKNSLFLLFRPLFAGAAAVAVILPIPFFFPHLFHADLIRTAFALVLMFAILAILTVAANLFVKTGPIEEIVHKVSSRLRSRY